MSNIGPLRYDSGFQAFYRRLAEVSMNPARHTSLNVWVHSELVRQKIAELAAANACSEGEKVLLDNLAMAHDIGKILGHPHPELSEAILVELGETDQPFLALVRFHDKALPWFQGFQDGLGPSDSNWEELAGKLDLFLLCLFMIADRTDCPGGWKNSQPTIWFLNEAQKRALLRKEVVLPDGF